MAKLRIGIIGDIVGRVGRDMVTNNLPYYKEKYHIDFVIANGENASGGFGLSKKNANQLLSSGIDVLSGGNHSFDKLEIVEFMDIMPILRPLNFPHNTPGSGIYYTKIKGEEVAIINAMGHYGININLENVFHKLEETINFLQKKNISNIIIDFHAEASSEKRVAFCQLRGRVAALFGTHTHIGSDDLHIQNGSFYVSDIGLCGGYDGVIGMDHKMPLNKAIRGYGGGRFEVLKDGNNIFQMIVLELENGKCNNAFKIKKINNTELENIKAFCLES